MGKIINIPFVDPPRWQSSTLTPSQQLERLGRSGRFVGDFKEYNRDENLAHLLKGKRIAYVCPSPHLRGLNMGEYIDSHDLVIRVNQAYHMRENDWQDYGKRTDILINCLNIHKRRALGANMDFANSLKYLICSMVNVHTLPAVNQFLSRLEIPTHNVCDGYLFKIFEQVGTTCNTGLTGIITLLNYDIESLYVTGMSFFNMNNFGKIYNDTYHDEAAKNNNFTSTSNKMPSKSDLRIDIHQQGPQIEYFRKMLDHHYSKKLKVDDYLIKNFNLEEK